MARDDWQDMIAGNRMAVDQEFTERVQDSEFTRQEWGLIMTAVEFEIAHPDDPDRARVVANTEKLPQIMPEVENVREQVQRGGAGGAGGGGSGAGGGKAGSSGSDGIVDSIKSGLGLGGGGGVDEERRAAAERLTEAYADELQSHLESRGRWEQVRTAAQE